MPALSLLCVVTSSPEQPLSNLTFEWLAHPFLPHKRLWLSSCPGTQWVFRAERNLVRALNRTIECKIGTGGPNRAQEIKKRPIVVDVGANCGLYTVAAATCGYETYAFEVAHAVKHANQT